MACNSLSKVPGLKCIRPRGAMYMMVGLTAGQCWKWGGVGENMNNKV